MDELIEALTIFSKYQTATIPIYVYHGAVFIEGVKEHDLTPDEIIRVSQLGFEWEEDGEEENAYVAYKFN